MSLKSNGSKPNEAREQSHEPPALARDAEGRIEPSSLARIIEWFIERDRRVNVVRHPRVEEVFRWKQAASREAGEEVFEFASAEDRFAVGVMQALMQNPSERELHEWIGQLLNALDEAAKTNEELAQAYRLDTAGALSPVAESEKIPTARGRDVYLTCCWLETLCTAEVRVLGWLYQELYGRPFSPENF
ncbi:MAG: hypothetical protein QOE33_1249 [Acidobacteriota bacterium]|jgi:hypothetical protein|nr:hypothetical protein [Acidobacteriota bacterium]